MKVVALSVHFKNGKRVVVGAVAGKGYSNEIKLGGQIIQWISFEEAFRRIVEGKTLLADKGYDSEDFICQVLSAGFKPYVKIRNQGIVRSEFRKVAQQFVDSDDLYKQRDGIEVLFGEVKQALGSYERTESFHIAMLFVLAKFILFNLCAVLVVMIFQTPTFALFSFLSLADKIEKETTSQEGTMAVPFTAYLLTAKEEIPHLDDDLILLLNEIVSATKEIAGKVRKAGLLSILGSTGKTNIQGEEVQKLDELANEILLENLKNCGKACQIASEEIEDCLIVSESGYTVAFDPLDGSSNIDVNVSIGTIFSIHKDSLIKPGREQLAAGYVIYGPSTMLIMSLGKGVVGFTFDPESGNFILSHPEIKLPEKGKIYSINEANRDKWTSEGLRKFVDSLKGEKYTLRYVGSMVADVHRTLLKGGIFIYPADKKNTNGKLRLLYEASPMSFLIEQAGGIGTTGRERILDIVPEDLHQRVPVIIGSKWEVEKCLEFLKEYDS
ncbi:hypothetical protein JCM12825_21690 [Desulfurobacterium crinifex]